LKRTLHATQPPRQLLTQAGYEIAEMYEADMCCGMGGTYSLKLPEISAPILERKAGQHQEQRCASGSNGLSRLRHADPRGLDKQRSTIRVEHTAQRLADELE